jgi:DNA-binding transcriptional ArsR family regulator
MRFYNLTVALINGMDKYKTMSELPLIFAALSEPTRFAIVERLMAEGELPAGAFLDDFDISAPAISRHLNVLSNAGLVTKRVNRQQRLYSARPETIGVVSAWAMGHREFWENSLKRLELALQQEMERK